MTSSTLDQLAAGSRVFIDASIFIYHFTASSLQCRKLLEGCASGRFSGFTSVTAVAEAALHVYQEQIELIPLMGIAIQSLDLEVTAFAAEIRRRHGLLVNDSLLSATAIREGITDFASADPDFERVEELRLFRPDDLASVFSH